MPKLKITLDDHAYLLVPQKFAALLPGADAQYVKCYLCALELAGRQNGTANIRDICIALGEGQKEVERAMEYWAGFELLCFSPDIGSVSFGTSPPEQNRESVQNRFIPPAMLAKDAPPEYLPGEVAQRIKADTELTQMFSLAQSILGRLLSSAATATLYSFYDWLGMPPEVILMLLEHCAEMGKRDMRYIEKVAISWHQMGIDSVDKADAYLKTQNKKNKYTYKIKQVLGIEGRSFTPSEQKYLDAWYEQFSASPDLVGAAFDYCVSQTGKLSFAYMNKVLAAWHEQKIRTPEQAHKANEAHAAVQRKKKPLPRAKQDLEVYHSGRYDYNQIEQAAREKLKNKVRKEQ